ncbi:MAG: type 4a pilus biogenesis protein PilO [Planctomycetota bacterium]
MPARTLDSILQATAVLSLVACGLVTYYGCSARPVGQVEAAEENEGPSPSAGDKLPEIRRALRQAETELEKAHAHAQQLRQRIPDDPDEAEFLKQVSRLAAATGLEIRDYRRGSLAVKESYSELQINLTCSARYAELCRFLEALDELPRILTIEKLAISSPDEGDEYPVDLSLSVYFRGRRQAPETEEAESNG